MFYTNNNSKHLTTFCLVSHNRFLNKKSPELIAPDHL